MTHKAASVSESSGLGKKCSALCMSVNAKHSKDSYQEEVLEREYQSTSKELCQITPFIPIVCCLGFFFLTFMHLLGSYLFLAAQSFILIVSMSAALPSGILVIYSLLFSPS